MARVFQATKQKIHNRGAPPHTFLNELIDWARTAPDSLFEKNARFDIYSSIVAELGPWRDLPHRKAVMLEALRVLAGFESSWNWNEGVDKAKTEINTPCTEETGIFQCSGNSMNFSAELKQLMQDSAGSTRCEDFITHTKADHRFAIEYCVRLIRLTTKHHGPIKGKHINPWLSRAAVEEFLQFLA